MFNVYLGNTCIYDDRSIGLRGLALINPTLVIEDNSAGSLTFTVAPDHPQYQLIADSMREVVNVYNDDDPEPLWTGRVLTIDTDFYKRKKVFCEGALAWLNDACGQDDTVRIYGALPLSDHIGVDAAIVRLNYALRGYNEMSWNAGGETHTIDKVPAKFKIRRGNVTVSIPDPTDLKGKTRPYHDSLTKTCYQKVMELQKEYGGHMQCKAIASGNVYLSWYKDYWQNMSEADFKATAKTVYLGENLLDLVKTADASNVFTVLRPLGEQRENPMTEAYIDETPERSGGHYLTRSGTFANIEDSKYSCSHTIEIDSEQEYFYTGAMLANNVQGAYYAVFDGSYPLYVKTAKAEYKDGAYQVSKISREQIIMPEGARYIRLCWYNDGETTPKLETRSPYAENVTYVEVSSLDKPDSPDLSPYIIFDQNRFNKYGWIEKVVKFDDVNMAEGLYRTAKRYIASCSFVTETFTVKYIDLGIVRQNTAWKPPKLYDPLHVISEAHGIDQYVYITKLNIPMDNPQNMTVTVGGAITNSISSKVGRSTQTNYAMAKKR